MRSPWLARRMSGRSLNVRTVTSVQERADNSSYVNLSGGGHSPEHTPNDDHLSGHTPVRTPTPLPQILAPYRIHPTRTAQLAATSRQRAEHQHAPAPAPDDEVATLAQALAATHHNLAATRRDLNNARLALHGAERDRDRYRHHYEGADDETRRLTSLLRTALNGWTTAAEHIPQALARRTARQAIHRTRRAAGISTQEIP